MLPRTEFLLSIETDDGDVGCWMLDGGYWKLDAECRMLSADLLYATFLGNSCRLWLPRGIWQTNQKHWPAQRVGDEQQFLDLSGFRNWLKQNANLG